MSVSQVCPGLFVSDLDSSLNSAVLTRRKIKLIVNASGITPLKSRVWRWSRSRSRTCLTPLWTSTSTQCQRRSTRTSTRTTTVWSIVRPDAAAPRRWSWPFSSGSPVCLWPSRSAWFWSLVLLSGSTPGSGSSSGTTRSGSRTAPRSGWSRPSAESCPTSRTKTKTRTRTRTEGTASASTDRGTQSSALFHLVMSSCGDTGSAPLCF